MTGLQYAGLTPDERALAETDLHMPVCDEPAIGDCPQCQARLVMYRRILDRLAEAGRLLPTHEKEK